MVKHDNGTLPPNSWSTGVQECRSGDGGMSHQSEDTKLISLAKELQDQVKQNAYLLRFFLILKNKHFCSSLKYQHFLKPKHMESSPTYWRKRKINQESKLGVFILYTFTPLTLAFVSPLNICAHTHAQHASNQSSIWKERSISFET